MRKALLTPIVAGVVSIGAVGAMVAAPIAAQASTGPTSTTFQVNGGSLAISTPTSANLGSAAIGAANVSSTLGAVTVTDQRASLSLASWTTSVTSSAFTTGGSSSNETIPATDVGYNPGAPTAQTGIGVFAPGLLTALGNISTPQPAYTAVTEIGATSVSWNPTITVTLPSSVVAGTYTGTITHSVA
jgi:hypothetical protein